MKVTNKCISCCDLSTEANHTLFITELFSGAGNDLPSVNANPNQKNPYGEEKENQKT